VRNLALEAGTPIPRANSWLEDAIAALHGLLGIDVNDPRTTFPGTTFAVIWAPREDGSPSPLHAALGIACLAVLPFRRSLPALARWFAVFPVVSFLLLSILLKWQPWHARLHLPIACMSAPAVGLVLGGVGWARFGAIVATLVGLGALPALALNNQRPLLTAWSVFRVPYERTALSESLPYLPGAENVAAFVRARGARRVAFADNHWVFAAMRPMLLGPRPRPEFGFFNPAIVPDGPRMLDPDVVVRIFPKPPTEVQPSLADQRSCAIYELRAVFQIYALYTRRRADPSDPFIGFNDADGLGPDEGPYATLHLPVLRWGLGPRTTIRFDSEGGTTDMDLCYWQLQTSGQELVVLLNGAEVHRERLLDWYRPHSALITLPTRRGRNTLEFVYSTWFDPPTDPERHLALAFERIRIGRESELAVPATPADGGR
jgi:hypothetical protein